MTGCFFTYCKPASNLYSFCTKQELEELLGKGRAKRGMFEGDIYDGELEIGQVTSVIKKIAPAAEILNEIWQQFSDALRQPLK